MAMRPRALAPDWSEAHHRGAAKCRTAVLPTYSHDVWFEDAQQAMAICNGVHDGVVCPRRTECLRVAMRNAEAFGVWGGMTPGGRLELRLRYPQMPERWTWHPEKPSDNSEEKQWEKAS